MILSPANLYSYICDNLEELSPAELNYWLTELKFQSFAKFLKFKFNDPRSISELVTVIKSEL